MGALCAAGVPAACRAFSTRQMARTGQTCGSVSGVALATAAWEQYCLATGGEDVTIAAPVDDVGGDGAPWGGGAAGDSEHDSGERRAAGLRGGARQRAVQHRNLP